ncbi:unnamed protein product, partial [Closterium sp. NIES-54]
MTTFWVLLRVAAQRDYELHSLDFSTAFLRGSLHEEIWLRRPPGFTGSFPTGTQWILQRPVYGLRQAFHEWHDTLRTTLAALGFTPSTATRRCFSALTRHCHRSTSSCKRRSYLGLQITQDRARRTITLTQSHMVHQVLQRFGFQFSSPQPNPLSTSHSLSAPPSDESVEPSGVYPELELRWLTYLLTDLGEQPHSPSVLTRATPPPAALLRRTACCRAAPPRTEPRRPAEPRCPAEPRRPSELRSPAEPCCQTEPRCPSPCTAPAATAASAASAAPAATATMASPTVLTFDAEGRAVEFDVW